MNTLLPLLATADVYGINVEGKSFHEVAIIIIVFGVPCSLAAFVVWLRHKHRLAREETLRQAVMQGDKVSPELLAMLTAPHEKAPTSMPSGVFLACFFAGIGAMIGMQSHYGAMVFFMFLGVGFVLRSYVAKKQ